MKISNVVILVCSFLMSSGAFAGNLIPEPIEAVGAEVILRQVATQKSFNRETARYIRVALEGSTNSAQPEVNIVAMKCGPGVTDRSCVIRLTVSEYGQGDAGRDGTFDVEARIVQGKVVSGGVVAAAQSVDTKTIVRAMQIHH